DAIESRLSVRRPELARIGDAMTAPLRGCRGAREVGAPLCRFVAALGALATLLAIGACGRGPVAPQLLRIFATDGGFELPAHVPAGLTEIRLVNHGRSIHEGALVHFLTAGARASAYVDSARAGVAFPAFAEDVGGPGLAEPGDSTTVSLELLPGRYCVVCFYADHL